MMKNTIFCPECDDRREYSVQTRKTSFLVRGEEIVITAPMPMCNGCGTELMNEELGEKALQQAYSEYRRRHNILAPAEISAIRNALGLSKRSLATLLGMGQVTIQRYEDGAIPDLAQSELIKSLRDPFQVQRLLNARGELLPASQRRKIKANLEQLQVEHLVKAVIGADLPSIENGFRCFDLERFAQMVLFFAQKENMWKTKLLKLLFYSDFTHFRDYSVSISGAPYLAYRRGPVPKEYDFLLNRLELEDIVALQFTPCGDYEGEVVQSLSDVDRSLLLPDELETLERVYEKLGRYSSTYLSELTHTEDAWSQTPQSAVIPYSYADSLKSV